jgi:predicted ferric reductase
VFIPCVGGRLPGAVPIRYGRAVWFHDLGTLSVGVPPRRSSGDLFGPLAVGSVLVVVVLWQVRHGFGSLLDQDTGWASLGLLSGLVASDLLLLQVILLARIPWIERAWGHDVLARRHRSLGFVSFWLMLLHVLAATTARLRGHGSHWRQTVHTLFVTAPWMLWASIGTLLLVLVVVTSIRTARRRLRYESWHLLHLYAYVGIALALPHQIVLGEDFQSVIARVYWWSLYAAAALAILTFRLGVPVWRSFRHQMRVASVQVEAPGVVSVQVEGRDLDRLGTRSGQFFIWRFLDGPGWTRGNPYTISAAPGDNRFRLTVRAAGDGSQRATSLRPGTRVLIEGPYGTMTAARRRHPRLLLMAAGVGITPIRALLEDSPYGPGESTLIYRFSQDTHAIFLSEIEDIATRRGVTVIYLPGRRRSDGSWQPADEASVPDDADALRDLVPELLDSDIFVCGPPAWVSAVKRAARRAGVERDQLHTEDFAW